jgi:SRSO17 transposase
MSLVPDPIDFPAWDTAFAALYRRIAPAFARLESRLRVYDYLQALLGQLDRKNAWTLAEQMGERGPHGVQRLLHGATWDVNVVRDLLQAYVVEHLGDPAGILILDETGFLKKGRYSAGVARQYSGTAGRIENQQIGVFLAYASARGASFIDRALYLPAEWTGDPQRCQRAGIPPAASFATKPELGRQMLEHALAARVPARWVVADSVYGTEDLCAWLEQQDLWYVLGVPATYAVWTGGQQVAAAALIAAVPAAQWVCLAAGAGSQGPRWYDWTWLELPVATVPDRRHWLLARRSVSDPTEYAYYHVYAASTTHLPEVVQVAGARWVIESGFAHAKGEVGLDQYQVRCWTGWYRVITLALVAYAYLAVVRAQAPPARVDQVRLSLPEIRRLLAGRDRSNRVTEYQRWWSEWRRRHQANARRGHEQRRARRGLTAARVIPLARRLPGLAPLTKERWAQIAPLLPAPPKQRGRPREADRPLLEAMLWLIEGGRTWRRLPAARGAWQTVHMRYQQWVKTGIWDQVRMILQEDESGCRAAA